MDLRVVQVKHGPVSVDKVWKFADIDGLRSDGDFRIDLDCDILDVKRVEFDAYVDVYFLWNVAECVSEIIGEQAHLEPG